MSIEEKQVELDFHSAKENKTNFQILQNEAAAIRTELSTLVSVILPFGRSTAPDGWLKCDGSAVSRTTYANLFAVIGTTFGVGDGSTTFNLPNCQGIGITGAGTQTINGRTKGGCALADIVEDQLQGFTFTHSPANPMVNSGAGLIASGSNYGAADCSNYGPTNDGSNGIPRIGTETKISSLVLNFFIKY